VMTGIAVEVAAGAGVGSGVYVGYGVEAGSGSAVSPPHAVSSNTRAVDSTSSFMDISFISTRPRCT